MRRKILYIVPTYGVPVKIGQQFAVDSVLVDDVCRARRAEAAAAQSLFRAHWQPSAAFRGVERRGGRQRATSKCSWSRASTGRAPKLPKAWWTRRSRPRASLTLKSGIGYFDSQGTRHPDEWQYKIDEEIKAASELSRKAGFETVLNVQAGALCGSNFPPPPQYLYDAAKHGIAVNAQGATAAAGASRSAPIAEGDFTFQVADGTVQNTGNSITLTLGSASDKSRVRFVYPFLPYKRWDHQRRNRARKNRGWRGSRARRSTHQPRRKADQPVCRLEALGAQDAPGRVPRRSRDRRRGGQKRQAALHLEKASLSANCWAFSIKGLTVTDAAGAPLWDDKFSADSTSRYQWQTSPRPGLNALWAWGWYGMAFDSYRFVPGAVGAQLTSFTAATIRTPINADPRMYSVTDARWIGNWVPRMLEQGVTATWGAVTEPYATFYAPGGNVFDHLWAGYNFGDSFYIAQNAVRWVMVAVGDPLYSPRTVLTKDNGGAMLH